MYKTITLIVTMLSLFACSAPGSWHTASRESSGLAPDPASHDEAVVQVYAADAWGWRGWFAVHTWISVKKSMDSAYTVYDVVGWRQRRGQPVVAAYSDIPDRHWYGAEPYLVADYRGAEADAMIDKIELAAMDYPWKNTYKVFPGPNSNTFVAWIGKQVPELALKLPFRAIGSGYADRNAKLQTDADTNR